MFQGFVAGGWKLFERKSANRKEDRVSLWKNSAFETGWRFVSTGCRGSI
jgi:hypothetical protein